MLHPNNCCLIRGHTDSLRFHLGALWFYPCILTYGPSRDHFVWCQFQLRSFASGYGLTLFWNTVLFCASWAHNPPASVWAVKGFADMSHHNEQWPRYPFVEWAAILPPAGLAGCPCRASVDGQEVAQWLARTHKIPRSVHSTSKTNTTKQKSSIKVQMYSRHSVWIHWSCVIFLSMLQCPDSSCQCYNVPTALIFVVLKPRYWSLQFFSFIRLF